MIDILPWQTNASEHVYFLHLVLDHVSDCLVVVDTEGMIVLINRPYCKLLGGDPADFIGRHICDVVGPHTRLHRVARGEEGPQIGYPLDVQGHRLITKQVPIIQGGRNIGAIGMALFSDTETLRRAYSRMAQSELSIQQRRKPWATSFSIDDISGNGPVMEAYRQSLRDIATYDFPALITGETGTGKELAAQAIHNLSARAPGPFVWINCASIPAELIDSELFGYESGAFTGARSRGKPGKFELADGGTLFLDEIGHMPMHLQGSLLRALQTGQIIRVGGTAPLNINVRIIGASNLPISEFTNRERFRADLFYRLNVLPIHAPALNERGDLPFLAHSLLEAQATRLGKTKPELSSAQIDRLLTHDWPGNIRELESVLTRYLVTGHLDITGPAKSRKPASSPHTDRDGAAATLHGQDTSLKSRTRSEKLAAVHEALERSGGNKKAAAQLLGISQAQIYRILKTGG